MPHTTPRVDPSARPKSLPPPRPGGPGRWRALTLTSVYVLMAAHIIHWKIAGRTLAPLELNEVMHTLELGVITAGFIFMSVAMLSVLVLGRFFCSWGCHILALEDLCAWLLRKLRIRPRPFRSRLLLWVPPLAFSYMFIWPQLARLTVRTWPSTEAWLGPRPTFELRIVSGGSGWESFVTDDFWRNLPSWPITLLTFAVCGFAIVWLLGSRSFCAYACPYGAAFSLADRVSPGKIKLTGTCVQCARCTATCSSGIRVHEEIERFGRVVSPSCMKDLDCVHSCPQGAIGFGFAKPAGFASLGPRRVRPRYDFSIGEELLIAGLFLGSLVIFRGLYDRIPFLLTLGIGAMYGTLAVFALRAMRRPVLLLRGLSLKREGRLTTAGALFLVIVSGLGLLLVHSGYIRAEEKLGTHGYQRVAELRSRGETPPEELVTGAIRHLERRQDWGLIASAEVERRIAELELVVGDASAAEARFARLVEARPESLDSRFALARVVALEGRTAEARRLIEPLARSSEVDGSVRATAEEVLASIALLENDADAAIAHLVRSTEITSDRIHARLSLAELWAARGELESAEGILRESIEIAPDSAEARRRLGLVRLARGDVEEAFASLHSAIELAPENVRLRIDLGRSHAGAGNLVAAEAAFRGALELAPEHPLASACLGSLLHDLGREAEARPFLDRAIEAGVLPAR